MIVIRSHDALFRFVFGEPEQMGELLRSVLDDLAATTEEELEARALSAVADLSLRFLQFLRLRRFASATEDIPRWQEILRRMLELDRGRTVLHALVSWLLERRPDADEVLRTVIARIHDSTTRQTMKSALDKLLERGELQGQRAVLRRLLTMRFGSVPDDIEARLASASADDLLVWETRILTARSIVEVLAPR